MITDGVPNEKMMDLLTAKVAKEIGKAVNLTITTNRSLKRKWPQEKTECYIDASRNLIPFIGDHLLAASPGSLRRSGEPFESLSLPSSPLENASGLA